MPVRPRPSPPEQPPRGVPRWLWPPPGAEVRGIVITERVDARGRVRHHVDPESAPGASHLRALRWLLDEHGRADRSPPGCPFEGAVRLQIARTVMPGGRIGHAYALNGGPLGAPGADGPRGVLWRYIEATVGT